MKKSGGKIPESDEKRKIVPNASSSPLADRVFPSFDSHPLCRSEQILYFVLDLTGQLKLSPKGYVNKSLIKVSALEACTVVSKQQINLSTSSRAPSPPPITVVPPLPLSSKKVPVCAERIRED